MDKIDVAVIAFDGISSFHLSVPCLIFHDVFQGQDCPFLLRVCHWQHGPLNSSSGFSIQLHAQLAAADSAEIIIIPSWHDVTSPPPAALREILLRANKRGATLVGLCLGAFAIAHTGLLDGLSATTHWHYAAQFRQQFPRVRFDPEPLYIEEKQIITSAGTAAAIDCCLQVVRRRSGSRLANQIARMLVTPPHRQGGQKQFIPIPIAENLPDQKLAGVLQEIASSPGQPQRIDSIASQCAMSRRTFTRHFRSMTGQSFNQWLLNQRLEYSQQLLEQQQPIAQVASAAGFGSETNFRKQFKRAYGVSPRDWRAAFGRG